MLFLKCCTLPPYTYVTLQPSFKDLFFAPPPSLFVYLQVFLQPATMPVRHAKRQPDTDPTSVPSASGISGSQTAPCPTGTSLLSDTDSGQLCPRKLELGRKAKARECANFRFVLGYNVDELSHSSCTAYVLMLTNCCAIASVIACCEQHNFHRHSSPDVVHDDTSTGR